MEMKVSKNLEIDAIKSYILALDAKREDSDVTPMKLQKLLYFAQANYLASTGFRLFDETTYAFAHGPVYRPVIAEHAGAQIIVVENPEAAVAPPTLPADVTQFIDEVWTKYGKYSAAQLRSISHSGHSSTETPWEKNFQGGFYDIIPDSDIAPYFRNEAPVEFRVFHPEISVLEGSFMDSLEEFDQAEVQRARAFLLGQGA
ncbi:Panacea domain-containing protein [Timonella senegalensis]|uniref:Panacea domain-containing protein n=1 Tax=Timonella senegalensis TaxID=1465825 RepID=UPI00030DBB21|nr:type II toxin-antitoxin system antitoxin SocA domain-containing protein [Timonella senegalensis]